MKFKTGNTVRLKGLKNEAFNGKLGQIIPGHVSDDERFIIALYDLPNRVIASSNRQIRIKPENMEFACDHCFAAGASMQVCGKCRVATY